VAEINHRANNAPSVSYLRTHSTVPPIILSHEQPTVQQVTSNVKATFEGVLDVIHGENCSKIIHTVFMFDEIATEKRIRWDPKTNYFLGLCREHAHHTATEFINEGDMEKLFQMLDDRKVHHAGEVRTFWFASAEPNLFSFLDLIYFRKLLVRWESYAKIIKYTLDVLSSSQETASRNQEKSMQRSLKLFSKAPMLCKTKQNSV
jgi:hypothetical protein